MSDPILAGMYVFAFVFAVGVLGTLLAGCAALYPGSDDDDPEAYTYCSRCGEFHPEDVTNRHKASRPSW